MGEALNAGARGFFPTAAPTRAGRNVEREGVALGVRLGVQQQGLEDVGGQVEAERGVKLRHGRLEAADA
jgi:hypothetical protein